MLFRFLKLIAVSTLFFASFFYFVQISSAVVPNGNYLELNGGFVKTNHQQLSSPQNVSFEIIFNPLKIDQDRSLITIGNAQNNTPNYQLGINGGGVSLKYWYANSSFKSVVTGSVSSNNWHTLKADISQSETKLTLDGLAIHTSSGAQNLKALGPDIYLGAGFVSSIFNNNKFYGAIDQVSLSQNGNNFLLWQLDSSRGNLTALDTSGNNLTGVLEGGDSKIHYFGVLPTPTKFMLPTLPPLPQISFAPRPTGNFVRPTVSFPSNFPSLGGRPVYPR